MAGAWSVVDWGYPQTNPQVYVTSLEIPQWIATGEPAAVMEDAVRVAHFHHEDAVTDEGIVTITEMTQLKCHTPVFSFSPEQLHINHS